MGWQIYYYKQIIEGMLNRKKQWISLTFHPLIALFVLLSLIHVRVYAHTHTHTFFFPFL